MGATEDSRARAAGPSDSRPPFFSVIMATRNRAHCICEAIDSVFATKYEQVELVIIDDASNDGTQALLEGRYRQEIAQGRMVLLRSDAHVGVSAARNLGLKQARGEWIAYADSDNKMRPGFFAEFARAISKHPQTHCFYARFLKLPNGHVGGKPYRRDQLLLANYIDLGVFIHRASLYDSLGGFDITLRRMVDWDVIIRYTAAQPPVFVPQILMTYDDRMEADRITTSESAPIARLAIAERYGSVPTVTTAIICYNQQDFIAEAIDSALRQKGYFAHEILLSDDGSTDATGDIVQSYARRFPNTVRDISRQDNRGMHENYAHVFAQASGSFIAILEGDDYWIDDHKLEKQVRFLADNSDCSMVFSKIEILEKTGRRNGFAKHDEIAADRLSGEDILNDPHWNPIGNFSSCMFRRGLMRAAPPILFGPGFSEIGVCFHLEQSGKIGFINETMSVYRKHAGGLWAGADDAARRRRARLVRETAKAVARKEFKPRIQAAIEEKFGETATDKGQ